MARKARNGIVYPYKVERKKKLADGTIKAYPSFEFKIDGKTYSCKKYADANRRLTELLQERAKFGSTSKSGKCRQTRQARLSHMRNNGWNDGRGMQTRRLSPTIEPSSASICAHTIRRKCRT